MALYAISDLHLSFCRSVQITGWDPEHDRTKPMDAFGWHQHEEQVRDFWLTRVKDADTVLLPGDLSWAMNAKEVVHDLAWIAQLPGKKILSPGNHCYYYRSKKQLRAILPPCMTWLDGDCTSVEGKTIVATRGWILPGDAHFREEVDRRIYERQVGRLRMALAAAVQAWPKQPLIAMLHFPPVTAHVRYSAFMDLLSSYQVHTCVYGHLHGNHITTLAIKGQVAGVRLQLVSCDALCFKPWLLSN